MIQAGPSYSQAQLRTFETLDVQYVLLVREHAFSLRHSGGVATNKYRGSLDATRDSQVAELDALEVLGGIVPLHKNPDVPAVLRVSLAYAHDPSQPWIFVALCRVQDDARWKMRINTRERTEERRKTHSSPRRHSTYRSRTTSLTDTPTTSLQHSLSISGPTTAMVIPPSTHTSDVSFNDSND